ncbi:MAG: hypothetical protein KAR21_02095 [Spirochaetales bacterium]|nr:hypothetical protein [Spirochaetales bacterium]
MKIFFILQFTININLSTCPGLFKFNETPLEELKAIEIENTNLNNIFPVLYKFYDTNPLGSALIRNRETEAISDITVNFFVDSYMTAAKQCLLIDKLEPGEIKEVNLFALFDERIMGITEATKVACL